MLTSIGKNHSGSWHHPLTSPVFIYKNLPSGREGLSGTQPSPRGRAPSRQHGRPDNSSAKSSAALSVPPEGGKKERGYWFLPCSDCTRPSCSHVLLLTAGGSALEGSDVPARGRREGEGKVPRRGCPPPSLPPRQPAALSPATRSPLPPRAPGKRQGRGACPGGAGCRGRGWPGPAPDGGIEWGKRRDKELRRADLILYINTLYNLGKARC